MHWRFPLCKLQRGAPARQRGMVRFCYEDRPVWWPEDKPYSADAVKMMGRQELQELHSRTIKVRFADRFRTRFPLS